MGVYFMVKLADVSPDCKWLAPAMDMRNTRGVTNAFYYHVKI